VAGVSTGRSRLRSTAIRHKTIIGLLGISTDITAQKETEQALQQSHDMIVKLAAQVPGVVYQYRLYPDGRSAFPFASPGMNDIYEVTPEAVREDATPVFERLHPDDADRIVHDIQESAGPWRQFHANFAWCSPAGAALAGFGMRCLSGRRTGARSGMASSRTSPTASKRKKPASAHEELVRFTYTVSHDLKSHARLTSRPSRLPGKRPAGRHAVRLRPTELHSPGGGEDVAGC